MTTAHRATWKAARGGLQEEGSFRLHVPSAGVSAKDAPTERELKARSDLPASRDELRHALAGAERRARAPKRRRLELPPVVGLGLTPGLPDAFRDGEEILAMDQDAVLDDGDPGSERDTDVEPAHFCDALGVGQPVLDSNQHKDKSEDEDDDDDSEDDEAELLAELERIKKEREFEKAKKKSAEQERLEREATAKAAAGNPLLPDLSVFNDEISDTASIATGSMPAFAVRRRWDDDVVFRNQTNGERKTAPRFINDTIRNDFHRRFMNKYMR